MADRISRSSTESVKLANRLSKTERDTRLDLNDNIDSFRAICFVANGVGIESFIRGLWSNEKVKKADFYAKDAILDVNNDPQIVDTRGEYWQCYVYYIDEDPKSWDPRVEEKLSAAYWGKVKKLHKALFPKTTSLFGLGEGGTPANQSEWKIKFLKGGPKRGEWSSGLAFGTTSGRPSELPSAEASSNSQDSSASPSPSTAPAKLPNGVESQPSKLSHWKCVNGSLVWAEGRRDGKLNDEVHNRRNQQLQKLLESDKEITMEEVKKQLPWLKISDYLEVVAASESGRKSYQAENDAGYYGKYQMGYEAMIQHGYLPVTEDQKNAAIKKHRTARTEKGSRYSKATTEQMFLDANWDALGMKDRYSKETLKAFKKAQQAKNGPAMMQIYKDDSNAQENSIAKYVTSRLQTIVKELDGDLSDVADIHGLSAGAHLVGFGSKISKDDPNYEPGRTGIKDLIESGKDTKDANKTTSLSYIKKSTEAYIAKNGNPCEDPEADGEPGESDPYSGDTELSSLIT